jgi:NDP-sugar pyrophosphorylase family protein
MKAIILAAGKGERLSEITRVIPKPMILYDSKPILLYNIELCYKYGIKNLFINTHHHANQIMDYFGNGTKYDVNIRYSNEEELLGTSGALNNFKDDLQSDPFFVIYGDQFSDFDLNLLMAKYYKHECLGTIAFHYRQDVSHSGVAEFDDEGKVLRFIEKPKKGESESHWVNAGIYYLNPKILEYIPDGFSDFGKQIFPNLLSENMSLYGVCEQKEVKVFDTPEMYKKNIRT